MTVDTSREAVEALITEHEMLWARGAYINVSLANQIEQTLATLLDERDRWQEATERVSTTRDLYFERIRDLEAERDNAIPLYEKDIRTLARRAERAEAERDAYKRAKAENDERFQIEAAEQRERADRLAAKLGAVKAALNASDHEPTNRVWHEQMQRLRAILADTDEPKAGWVCSKCAREAVRGYDDGQIPEHHRTCSKRMPDTDEPKDSITFNTDDLGPATDIDGNPLADTDEGNGK